MPATAPAERLPIDVYSRRSHPKQREFHSLCNRFREVHFVGGRQSGKTDSGAAELVKRTIIEPLSGHAEYLLAAPTYDRTLAARYRFQEYLPWGTWTKNAQEKRYEIRGRNGATSRVWWRNADEDAPRSLTLNGAWVDEAAFCPERFFDNLRPALAVHDGALWTTSTPKGQNYHYRFYDPIPAGVGVVYVESRDNPSFGEIEWVRAIRRYGYESAFFQQEHRGLAAAFVGMALKGLDPLTLIQDVSWHDDHAIVVGVDPGWTAGTGSVLVQISPDEKLTIWGFRYWTETPRHIVINEMRWPWCDQLRPKYAIDPSGSSGRAPETGDIGWQQALEDIERLPNGQSMVDVRWNRMVGESAGLMILRQLIEQGRFRIARKALGEVHGGIYTGADEIKRILMTAELSKNLEKDEMDETHPQAELVDCLRYVAAVYLPHLQRKKQSSSRHGI